MNNSQDNNITIIRSLLITSIKSIIKTYKFNHVDMATYLLNFIMYYDKYKNISML